VYKVFSVLSDNY